MAYQVIARKWRPQRFDDVVGQQAVTRTLRNALGSGRLAQAFVFAGPRGVGKTTTARILARALSCETGPTAEPCGVCDACVEIAEGRDIDVLEIDAATHTGVDNVREVIIAGLGIMPVRNRYKVFIIDEVHQLSTPSFNALLKSIEEPPAHVVFMMATTELDKIPETVLSRSQVYEFRTIGTKAIADQLRKIVDAEGIQVRDDSLLLIARDAEGSMRDAQSKLDQVIAFTGTTIAPEDVATVLGLVGRDLLLNTFQAVADEDAVAAFTLAGHAVDMGYDLRLVCRELSRMARDLLVLSVDPSRATDPEIAADGERDQLLSLAKRFSREDLMRSFDLLTKAELDIRGAAQPRYHLEMALLRWIHLRKLVPIEELIQSAGAGAIRSLPTAAAAPPRPAQAAPTLGASSVQPRPVQRPASPSAASSSAPPPSAPAKEMVPSTTATPSAGPASLPSPSSASGSLKDALLAEIRKSNAVMYNAFIALAQRFELTADRLVLTFAASQKMTATFDKYKPALEAMVTKLAGRKVFVIMDGSGTESASSGGPTVPVADVEKKSALKEKALADPAVQALFEVFPGDIRDVEEL